MNVTENIFPSQLARRCMFVSAVFFTTARVPNKVRNQQFSNEMLPPRQQRSMHFFADSSHTRQTCRSRVKRSRGFVLDTADFAEFSSQIGIIGQSRIQGWESEVTGSNPIFCQGFEIVDSIPIFCVFTKKNSPSCNKVARRPIETVPWRAHGGRYDENPNLSVLQVVQ